HFSELLPLTEGVRQAAPPPPAMGTPKPLIVPWLRRKLDAGCYPGVSWLDPGRTQFRVPWKHGLRQDASAEDFQLFR
ncbi:interferon regulatory factor 3, partial [Chelydra serpentina]